MVPPFDVILIKTFWAVFVSLGFAVLFNTPKRALWVVALLGAIGYGVKIFLMKFVFLDQIVLASLIGASTVGLLGVYFAHRVHTPPIAFTVPAVINMIPGKYGYQFIIGLLKIVTYDKHNKLTFEELMDVLNNGLLAGFVILALSFGVIVSLLLFNTSTVKGKDPHVFINQNMRKTRVARYKRKKQKF